ncbi:MAG TPA: ATP-binding protein, partial [Casimicrobiaceae bacterium]|nr:ATP-binding protein [Casimicrobiaceae bacterium]
TIDVTVAPDATVHAVLEDLEEMLGNLLDNACKWARSRVAVSAETDGDRVVLTVDDDGPGLDAALREQVLQRGVRADEASPGSGLGLSIVRDLADAYGGSIALQPSPLGGLRATLSLGR